MCRCLCLVLLAIAQGLREGRLELELEPSPLEELRRNASSESWEDRENVAKSSELAELVRRNSTEAVEILRNLTRVKYFEVKIGVAESSALKALVETRPEEGAQLVKDLVKDEDFSVRVAVAASPALETLVEQRPKEGFQMVMLLLESDRDLRMHRAAYEWWPAFEQYATPFANDFNSSLHGSWEEKVSVARNSSWRAVLNLNWEDGKRLFTTLIQDADPDVRSAAIDSPAWNMLFRYDVAEGSLPDRGFSPADPQAVGRSDDLEAARRLQQSIPPLPVQVTRFNGIAIRALAVDLDSAQLSVRLRDVLRYSSDLESISDAVEACYQMYKQAFVAKRAYFDAMVKKIGQTTGAEARFCAESLGEMAVVKGLLRLAEKHCLRPKSGIIWDGIRAMLVGTSLDQLSEALHGLQAEQKAGRLKIIQINNRFAKPTQDNWQDIAEPRLSSGLPFWHPSCFKVNDFGIQCDLAIGMT
eukprot:Skav215732  [mRNA]  locus=scaffold2859:40318:47173:+ [translate_table: standard]